MHATVSSVSVGIWGRIPKACGWVASQSYFAPALHAFACPASDILWVCQVGNVLELLGNSGIESRTMRALSFPHEGSLKAPIIYMYAHCGIVGCQSTVIVQHSCLEPSRMNATREDGEAADQLQPLPL